MVIIVANVGWICMHRSMLEWEWYGDINVCRLFIHLLLNANHKDARWRGTEIKKGSLIVGRDSLSAETGLSVQQIRTALKKLKSTNEITIKTTSKNSLISIVKWDEYQDKQPANQPTSNQQVTSNQPTSNQQVTTNNNNNNNNNNKNKEDKKINKKTASKEIFKKPTEQEVELYASDKKLNLTGFFDFYESNGWRVGKNPMKSWQAAASGWHKRQGTFTNKPHTETKIPISQSQRRVI